MLIHVKHDSFFFKKRSFFVIFLSRPFLLTSWKTAKCDFCSSSGFVSLNLQVLLGFFLFVIFFLKKKCFCLMMEPSESVLGYIKHRLEFICFWVFCCGIFLCFVRCLKDIYDWFTTSLFHEVFQIRWFDLLSYFV